MPKEILIGSVWKKKSGGIYVITKEKNEELFKQFGILRYCQEIGCVGGVWASEEFILNNMFEITPNFSTASRI